MWKLDKGKKFLPSFSLERLNKLYSEEKNAKAKLRLLVAIRRKRGESLDDIRLAVEKPRRTVHGWLQRFQERGLKGAYDKKQPGREPLLSKSELKQFRRELLQGPAHVPGRLWTTRLVQEHIKKKYGVSYKRHNIIRLLHKLGFSVQKPRQQHYKANKEAQEQFKKKQDGYHHTTDAGDGRLRLWMNVRLTSNLTSLEDGH